jgi:hypothetical protein
MHVAGSLGSHAKCRIARTAPRGAARGYDADPSKPDAETHGMPTRTFGVRRKRGEDIDRWHEDPDDRPEASLWHENILASASIITLGP